MREKRLVLFLIMIALGLGFGLVYGWVINPVKYAEHVSQPAARRLQSRLRVDGGGNLPGRSQSRTGCPAANRVG